jgi:hypothetical protein
MLTSFYIAKHLGFYLLKFNFNLNSLEYIILFSIEIYSLISDNHTYLILFF